MKRKRNLIVVLSLVVALVLPTNALAATHDNISSADALTEAYNNDTDSEVVINLSDNIGAVDITSRSASSLTINANNKIIDGGVSVGGDGSVAINDVTITASADGTAGLSVKDSANVTVDGTVRSGKAEGVTAVGGATVTVDGLVNGQTDGVYAHGNASVTVEGQIIANEGVGIKAEDDATVSVSEPGRAITSRTDAVNATDNAQVSVEGSIKSAGNGVVAQKNANVTVEGNIEAATYGVNVDGGSGKTTVEVTGNITTKDSTSGAGVKSDYAVVKIKGDINSASTGVRARADVPENTVEIEGNITAGGDGLAISGYDVAARVIGSITAGNNGIVSSTDGSAEVKGNVTGGANGIYAPSCGNITVTGDVSGKNGSADSVESTENYSNGGNGINIDYGKVIVNGNVSGGTSYGVQATGGAGIIAKSGAKVTVSGNVTGGDQVAVKDGGTSIGGGAGNGIDMERSATVSVGGNVTGGSSDATAGSAGKGVYIDMPLYGRGNIGSLKVEGTISGGEQKGNATSAGNGVFYNFKTKDKEGTGDNWTLADMPTVTLFKLVGGTKKDGTKAAEIVSHGYASLVRPSADEINSIYNYIVKVINTENGTIESVTAHPGETVTLKITPDSGYKLAGVELDGAVLKSANGVYSYVVPTYGGVTASATFTAASTTPVGPATGDTSNLALWIILMVASAAAIVAFVIIKKKKH